MFRQVVEVGLSKRVNVTKDPVQTISDLGQINATFGREFLAQYHLGILS